MSLNSTTGGPTPHGPPSHAPMVHPPKKEDAEISACEIYRLVGDIEAMMKIGCDNIPDGSHHGPFKTIPVQSERGIGVDRSISKGLRYVLLGLMLTIAVIVMLTCCCQMYARIENRRRALYRAFRARFNENTSSARNSCRPVPQRPCQVPIYRPPPPAPAPVVANCVGKTAIAHNDCYDCSGLNIIWLNNSVYKFTSKTWLLGVCKRFFKALLFY